MALIQCLNQFVYNNNDPSNHDDLIMCLIKGFSTCTFLLSTRSIISSIFGVICSLAILLDRPTYYFVLHYILHILSCAKTHKHVSTTWSLHHVEYHTKLLNSVSMHIRNCIDVTVHTNQIGAN